MNTTAVVLTDEELTLLDGRCSERVQAEVDSAKQRIEMAKLLSDVPQEAVRLIQEIVDTAKKDGELTFYHANLKKCDVCGSGGEYYTYSRSSKYHRKGQPDYDHPIYLDGIEMRKSFIRMKGYVDVGCCSECFAKYQTLIADALKDVEAEIPEKITGEKPKYKKYDNRKCSKCGWMGHEGQMGKSPTLMGDGYYPSTCPQCRAENGLFSNPVKIDSGFTMVKIA